MEQERFFYIDAREIVVTDINCLFASFLPLFWCLCYVPASCCFCFWPGCQSQQLLLSPSSNMNRRLVDLFNWPALFAYWSLTAGFPRLAYPMLPSTFQWRTHVQPHTTCPESFRRRPQSILDTECLSHIP